MLLTARSNDINRLPALSFMPQPRWPALPAVCHKSLALVARAGHDRDMRKAVLAIIIVILGAALAQGPPARLDMVVREDFFAGLRGDKERFDRAMKKCEEL